MDVCVRSFHRTEPLQNSLYTSVSSMNFRIGWAFAMVVSTQRRFNIQWWTIQAARWCQINKWKSSGLPFHSRVILFPLFSTFLLLLFAFADMLSRSQLIHQMNTVVYRFRKLKSDFRHAHMDFSYDAFSLLRKFKVYSIYANECVWD